MRELLRADLSGPVLAIIVTVGVIAAGLAVLAYFWWLAPQASKTATLTVVGEPSLMRDPTTGNWTLYITLKNAGTENVTVKYVVINGAQSDAVNQVITPGEKADLSIRFSQNDPNPSGPSVEGVVVTDGGVYPFSAYVIK